MRKLILLVLVCAAPVYGQNATTDFRTGAGCGPRNVQYDVRLSSPDKGVAAPSSGKARIYVIEPVGTNNTGITRVGLDGHWVGANTGNGYISFEVDLGNHNICAEWQSIKRTGAATAMTAEPGKTYYFLAAAVVQWVDFSLTRVDDAEGQWLLSISQKSAWTQNQKK